MASEESIPPLEETLIELVHKSRCLYDKGHTNYYNADERKKEWDKINSTLIEMGYNFQAKLL